MKSSNYNFLVKLEENNSIAYNSFTSDLSLVDERFNYILNNISDITMNNLDDDYKEVYRKMEYAGYIIDDSIEEIDYLKAGYYGAKYQEPNNFSATIAPTLNCNFGCEYCFEERQEKSISHEVEEKIYEIIQSQAEKGKSINISWFGGEPMLEFDAIVRMTAKYKKICDENNVPYSAGMITNGYLFNKDRIETLKDLSIGSMQITIDGPQHVHDQRRILLNGGPTFNKIIENIKLLVDAKQNVTIRINIDNSNVDDIDELLAFFKSEGIDSTIITFGHVKVINKSCSALVEVCLSRDVYSTKHLELSNSIVKNNLVNRDLFPQRKSIVCTADSSKAQVIDPEGFLYKCWNDIGIKDKRVGSILNNPTAKQTAMEHKYLLHSPFENNECYKCGLLPICMGNCPASAIFDDYLSCHIWKDNFEDHIVDYYKSMQNQG